MKKRIECKVIRSVPLDGSRDSTRYATTLGNPGSIINDLAAFTYTARLIATRTRVDDGLTSPILDLYI